VGYVIDALERALVRLPVKIVLVKDDTFTANRKRVLALCECIRAKKLAFLWSCDTRADVLDDALLREMRLAGCQQLSLGVESGSPEILARIGKKLTVEAILASTELAKKYGIRVRYYMMLGNRGETAETFRETLKFLELARPHQYLFSCLSIYPGTRDFEDAERLGLIGREAYFHEDFQELKVPFDASPADAKMFSEWFHQHAGLQEGYRATVAELEAILERLGEHHAAHLDLASALFDEAQLDRSEHHAQRALALGHPLPGLVLNHLACIAHARGNLDGMMNYFSQAAKIDPQHWVLMKNVQAARAWFGEGGPGRGRPLQLAAKYDFQLLERTLQPNLPGPLRTNTAMFGESGAQGSTRCGAIPTGER
jgi:tetratricopeptide (TPR) repeat protein